MLAYILRRLLVAVPVLLIVATFVFALIHVSPGDPVFALAGSEATDEDRARIRTELGLDQSLLWQFALFLVRILHGDLGRSLYSGQALSSLVLQRAEPTVSLTVVTLVVAIAFGV